MIKGRKENDRKYDKSSEYLVSDGYDVIIVMRSRTNDPIVLMYSEQSCIILE